MAGEMADNIPFGKLFHHGPQEMWNVALIALFERFSDNKLQSAAVAPRHGENKSPPALADTRVQNQATCRCHALYIQHTNNLHTCASSSYAVQAISKQKAHCSPNTPWSGTFPSNDQISLDIVGVSSFKFSAPRWPIAERVTLTCRPIAARQREASCKMMPPLSSGLGKHAGKQAPG
eukprot:scaffold328920_cov52-Tisochrysis_lutea.AAC.1